MTDVPKWFKPVAIVALLWNLIGCAAYLGDVMTTPEQVAQMPPAQQALYNSRPAWAVAATAVAVWAGALGCIGLILRKRWARPVLDASLAGVVVQDVAIFLMSDAAAITGSAVYVLQTLVLVIAIALVLLARRASERGWLN
jgi:hypothetical protein